MSIICPTVLADTIDEFREQMQTVAPLTSRLQIDLGDGNFAQRTIGVADVWWPDTTSADIHLMYQEPFDALRLLVNMNPNMIILHAESSGDMMAAIEYIQQHTIKVGLAILQRTAVSQVSDMIARVDHALIFSGSLGSFGGEADLSLLGKVEQIRVINPDIEIGWDGGANEQNVASLSGGGIDVINVGGAIQRANHPENAFRSLQRLLYD